MARAEHVDLVEVHCWGQLVGAVAQARHSDACVFEYDPRWRRSGIELSPLLLPTRNRSGQFSFPGLSRETYKGLPGLLADALPDRFGNALIDAWMAQRGIPASAISVLDRLAYMGSRGMGALQFRPVLGNEDTPSVPIQLASLVEAARRAVSGSVDDSHAAQSLNRIIEVGTSAGGARAKAVIGWNRAQQQIVSGQFDLPDGFEHWLLKFDGVGSDAQLGPSQQYGRIEYAYHLMARAAGIDMADCQLLEEGGRAHFVTRRFDRQGNTRLHLQSLCAMAHVDYNLQASNAYETLFITAAELGLDDAAMTQLLRRMVFNVAAANNDDHSKNFAFLLPPPVEGQALPAWQLAPAYDITYAFDPDNQWLRQHLMSVNGRFAGITRADLARVADRFSIAGLREVIDSVNAAVQRWPEFAGSAGLDPDETARIGGHLQRL